MFKKRTTMPQSIRENDADVIKFVEGHDIKTVLDVGAGRGIYGEMLRPYVDRIDAVEVWKPYISEFDLPKIYDSVVVQDIRYMPMPDTTYDLIVFGDVLEHMGADESKMVWKWAAHFCKYGLISVPIIHWPQGAENGNPYEVHVQEHMTSKQIRRDFGPFVFERNYNVTGTYIKRFL